MGQRVVQTCDADQARDAGQVCDADQARDAGQVCDADQARDAGQTRDAGQVCDVDQTREADQTRDADDKGRRATHASARELAQLLLPVGGFCIALGLHLFLPNVYPDWYEPRVYVQVLVAGLALFIVLSAAGFAVPRLQRKLIDTSPWICVVCLLLAALDVCTLKTGLFILPFMPSPDKTMYSFIYYAHEIATNFGDSLVRLAIGLIIGGATGFVSGVLMGWSKVWDYWMAPVLKFIGPLPSAAWVPIAVTIMPTNRMAGLFLISIAMWFPVTLMLSSGIKATPRSKIEAARVLGASEGYILLHVALPSALNSLFTGIFMGLSSSFSALLVAETMGVKAGLGWLISWANGWADYGLLFAIEGIFVVLFFLMITALFAVRDRVMKWQEGIVKW